MGRRRCHWTGAARNCEWVSAQVCAMPAREMRSGLFASVESHLIGCAAEESRRTACTVELTSYRSKNTWYCSSGRITLRRIGTPWSWPKLFIVSWWPKAFAWKSFPAKNCTGRMLPFFYFKRTCPAASSSILGSSIATGSRSALVYGAESSRRGVGKPLRGGAPAFCGY